MGQQCEWAREWGAAREKEGRWERSQGPAARTCKRLAAKRKKRAQAGGEHEKRKRKQLGKDRAVRSYDVAELVRHGESAISRGHFEKKFPANKTAAAVAQRLPASDLRCQLLRLRSACAPHSTAPPHRHPAIPPPDTMPFRAKTLQITWHAKTGSKNDPLLSIDFHPTLNIFATAGADNEVKIWRLLEAAPAAGGGGGARAPGDHHG